MGAVGVLGYVFSGPGRQSRVDEELRGLPPSVAHAQAYPWGPGTEVQRAMDADRRATQARWEQSQRPAVTGVVAPGARPGQQQQQQQQQPFFASARRQNTNDGVKQRRMEMFTGAVDAGASETGTYRRKGEQAAMFRPDWSATAVTSGGSAGNAAFTASDALASRFASTLRQNNVLPTEQVRVGRGVGVGVDVPASDGFHPMLRVMPTNVNEARLNNLVGGVVAGSSAVASRAAAFAPLVRQRPETFWEQSRYPMAPGKAVLDGPTERPLIVPGACGGRLVGDDYYGGATVARGGTYGPAAELMRLRDDNTAPTRETNLTAALHGMGGFVNASFDGAQFDSQNREQPGEVSDGVLTGGTRAPTADAGIVMQNTNRSLHESTGVTGNPASSVATGSTRPVAPLDRTLREQLEGQTALGVATPYVKGPSVQETDKWLDRNSKRHDQIVTGWVPPPHKANDTRVVGIVQIRPRTDVAEARPLPTVVNPSAVAHPGQNTVASNKLPPTNMRLDLNLARDQLGGNPINLSIAPQQ